MGRRKHQGRKPRKAEKRSSVKKSIEAERRKETIFGSLIIIGIIVVAVVGGWYLLNPSGQGSQLTESQITVFTISDLSTTTSPDDEHPGTLAPNFSLTDPNGTSSWLSDFRGKVVVIDFMATECGPCRLSMPELKTVWNDYEGRIIMMSISITAPPFDDTKEMIRDWTSEWEATWIHAKDTIGVMFEYDVISIPTFVIIDKDGYIRSTLVPTVTTPFVSAEMISKKIDELL